MNSSIKIALCGPSDVTTEIQKAKEVINEFNQREFANCNVFLKHLHWEDNSTPDMSKRVQEILNFQIIDEADIVVAIFRNRIGTSTGLYDSGTEEEIKRAVTQKKRVMIYFSSIETTVEIDENQKNKLEKFKNKINSLGLYDSFSSLNEFKNKFHRHLLSLVSDFKKNIQEEYRIENRYQKEDNPKIQQNQIGGHSNIQAGVIENLTVKAPKPLRISIEPPAGSITQEELMRIHELKEKLAEGEVKMDRSKAYGLWTNRIKKYFNVAKLDFIKSEQMPDVEAYCKQQLNLQKAGYKTKAPDQWRRNQYGVIKAAMKKMGKTESSYYSELANRLKIKSGFTSLKDLTKINLEKVRNAVKRDLENWENDQ